MEKLSADFRDALNLQVDETILVELKAKIGDP